MTLTRVCTKNMQSCISLYIDSISTIELLCDTILVIMGSMITNDEVTSVMEVGEFCFGRISDCRVFDVAIVYKIA